MAVTGGAEHELAYAKHIQKKVQMVGIIVSGLLLSFLAISICGTYGCEAVNHLQSGSHLGLLFGIGPNSILAYAYCNPSVSLL